MHVLVENGIFTEVWNEGLCLMISVDPNIALHVSIQKVIPVLKTLFSVSFYGSTIQQMHRDFKLIGKVLVFKPYASDYCNRNSENAEWEAQEFFLMVCIIGYSFPLSPPKQVNSKPGPDFSSAFFFKIKWSGVPTRFFPTSTHFTKSFLMFPIRAALQANHV